MTKASAVRWVKRPPVSGHSGDVGWEGYFFACGITIFEKGLPKYWGHYVNVARRARIVERRAQKVHLPIQKTKEKRGDNEKHQGVEQAL